MKLNWMHVADKFYVARMPDGSVGVAHQPSLDVNQYPKMPDVVVPPEAWASGVAHVSATGDTHSTWNKVLDLHSAKADDAPEKTKSAGEIAADALDIAASFADPIANSVGGVSGMAVGIIGGVVKLGALLARAFGSDAPVKLAKMRSSIAERLKREKNIEAVMLALGVT